MILPFDPTPFFALLTILVVGPAVAFAVAALRRRHRRQGPVRLVVERRPPADAHARSA